MPDCTDTIQGQQPWGIWLGLLGSTSPVSRVGWGCKAQLIGLVMLETYPYAFQQVKWALLKSWSGPVLTAMFWRTIFLQGTWSLHLIFTAILDDDVPVMLAMVISETATADVCNRLPFVTPRMHIMVFWKHQQNLNQSFGFKAVLWMIIHKLLPRGDLYGD